MDENAIFRGLLPSFARRANASAAAWFVQMARLVDAADLIDAADYQNHPRAEGGDVPVVVLQGRDGCVVRGGDRRQGFAALYTVMENRVWRCRFRRRYCCSLGSGGKVVRST